MKELEDIAETRRSLRGFTRIATVSAVISVASAFIFLALPDKNGTLAGFVEVIGGFGGGYLGCVFLRRRALECVCSLVADITVRAAFAEENKTAHPQRLGVCRLCRRRLYLPLAGSGIRMGLHY